MDQLSYRRHRFPPPIIQHAIWLYLRFTLSYRDVAYTSSIGRVNMHPDEPDEAETDAKIRALFRQLAAVEEKMAAITARSVAGLIEQMEALKAHISEAHTIQFWWSVRRRCLIRRPPALSQKRGSSGWPRDHAGHFMPAHDQSLGLSGMKMAFTCARFIFLSRDRPHPSGGRTLATPWGPPERPG
jgi:hypothetical protein